MVAPQPYQKPEPLNPRLVTKTSLPRPKAALALALILWYVHGRSSSCDYGCARGVESEGGIINDAIVDGVKEYAESHGFDLASDVLKAKLKDNPLLTSQMESLNAAFELVWKLARISFCDSTKNRSSERSNGVRFQKHICFSTNLDLIDVLAESDQSAFASVLVSWITDGLIKADASAEQRLIHMLLVFSNTTIYSSGKAGRGTIYSIRGVYGPLLGGADAVDIVDSNEKEVRGPTRILQSAIGEGLYPGLAIKKRSVSASCDQDGPFIRDFVERMRVSADLSTVKVGAKEGKLMKAKSAAKVNVPRNYIFFGAPDTGKSFGLNKLAESCFSEGNIKRVTFYPDYTYSQFVGCYKPIKANEVRNNEPASKHSPEISYDFVPGPFLETYVKAVQNPDENYLLIVEEINRSNPAAVFGDVFQLLDRDDDGKSVYPVDAPLEMRAYLKKNLICTHTNDDTTIAKEGIEGFVEEGARLSLATEKLQLPGNMYIWATMNSADQGVFPMDTAFKRRWDFRYMGIDEGEDTEVNGRILSEIEVPCGGRNVLWNSLRHAINEFMLSDNLKINEDKLLGPFFISPSSLTPERFGDVFKDKVLLYLYEDAGKTKHSKMFKKELNTYAKVCTAFDAHGEEIFGAGFNGGLVHGVNDNRDAEDSKE